MLDGHRKSSIPFVLSHVLTVPSSDTSGESHKNEGFLKSIWHKLTENPEHEAETSGASTKSDKPSKDDKKSESKGNADSEKDDTSKKQ
jgi:hypothetical protein